MKILVTSVTDSAGGTAKLARAIDGLPGHDAVAIAYRPSRLRYETPFPVVERAMLKQTLHAWRWCDAVVCIGPWCEAPKDTPWGSRSVIPPGAPKRPLVVNYRGTPYRQRHAHHDRRDQERGYVQTGNFIDLTIYGKRKGWLPVPVWGDEVAPHRKHHGGRNFLVTQAVTKPSRFPIKKTHQVRDALKELKGVKFEIVTQLPHGECLDAMGRADVIVTAFKNGYGNAGLEAMAMGIPVIAGGPFGLIGAYHARLGELPFAVAAVETVRDVVADLKNNSARYAEFVERGHGYIAKHHAPDVVGKRAVLYCELATERMAKKSGARRSPPRKKPPPEPGARGIGQRRRPVDLPAPRPKVDPPVVVAPEPKEKGPSPPHGLLGRRKPNK